MRKWSYLWHWAPKQRRASIRSLGLRRMFWDGSVLVLHACGVGSAKGWLPAVQDRVGKTVPLEGWLLRVRPELQFRMKSGVHVVWCDVLPEDMRGPYAAAIDPRLAPPYFAQGPIQET